MRFSAMAFQRCSTFILRFGVLEHMSDRDLFIVSLPDAGMLLTRNTELVDDVRRESLRSPYKRNPSVSPTMTPMYVQPRNTAVDFIHTDYIARLLQSRIAQYTVPCTDLCRKVDRPCRTYLAGTIQLTLGTDAASIVGEYMHGKGWPGQHHTIPFFDWLRVCSCTENPVCACLFCR
jgi:hypothetical protein